MSTTTDSASRSFVIDREFPHAPAKVWRALTDGGLLAEWLLANDFEAKVGHRFTFRNEPMPQWDGVVSCEVLTVEPPSRLAYTWRALGLDTVVTFTLTPTATGTQLRMEQSGFRDHEGRAFAGAQYGWQRFLTNLDRVVGALS